jgi:hypothetical protein
MGTGNREDATELGEAFAEDTLEVTLRLSCRHFTVELPRLCHASNLHWAINISFPWTPTSLLVNIETTRVQGNLEFTLLV